MEVFVARQPIFDRKRNVVAYELLFRSNNKNYYDFIDGDKATYEVINNSFMIIGIKTLTEGKRAFINFTEKLLLDETPLSLPKDDIAVEILEDIPPSEEILRSCRRLKEEGYILALDDFIFRPEYEPLLDFVDIIKVDFLNSDEGLRREIVLKAKNKNIKLLAEKVETLEDFNEAFRLGYSYFQGYFFSKPKILKGRDIPSDMLFSFRLLKLLKDESKDFNDIENIFKKDISLSYKLLKYINSASIGLKTDIHSIRQALVLLGRKELIKWISVITLKEYSRESNTELMSLSITRARFGELISERAKMKDRACDVFLMEMFSNIDAFLDKPMYEILKELPITEDIKAALLGEGDNAFVNLHKLILSYEKGDFDKAKAYSRKISLAEDKMSELYVQSVDWASRLIIKEVV